MSRKEKIVFIMTMLVVAAAVFTALWAVVVTIEDYNAPPRPCSDYANEQMQYLPARCVQELLR